MTTPDPIPTPAQDGAPLWNDEAITDCMNRQSWSNRIGIVYFGCLYTIRAIEIAQGIRDQYEAERATLTARVQELEAQLAEKRKPMRVVIQPDFTIDLEDE